MKRAVPLFLALLAACTGEAATRDDEDPGWGSSPAGSSSSGANGSSRGNSSSGHSSSTSRVNPNGRAFVYGHSSGSLYLLDADTLDVTLIGTFRFFDQNGNPTSDEMTDIAVDADGNVFGCSYDTLYRVDRDTAEATKIASLSDSYNGLTFVPAGMIEPNEILVGASNTFGNIYKIDTGTGAATSLGRYGGSWKSSGDIVAINGDHIYATVNTLFNTTDHLATIDPTTGTATVMNAAIGFNDVWGLGYWAGVLYGFTETGLIITIDTGTGVGTQLFDRSTAFWGAGVTTNAKLAN